MPTLKAFTRMRDRLVLARYLLLAAVFFTAISLAVAALAVLIQERSATGRNAAVMRLLNLSGPALIPSGHAGRHPQTVGRGINRRYSPQLPVIEPGTDGLLLPKPPSEQCQ